MILLPLLRLFPLVRIPCSVVKKVKTLNRVSIQPTVHFRVKVESVLLLPVLEEEKSYSVPAVMPSGAVRAVTS